MDDQNTPQEPVEDHVGKTGGIIMLVVILFLIVMGTGSAGVMLAVGFLVLWAVFAGLGRWFKKNQGSNKGSGH